MQYYIYHPVRRVQYLVLLSFSIIILLYRFLRKLLEIVENVIFSLNFRLTEKMIFPTFAKNQENIILTLCVFFFSKMLFFMQCQEKSRWKVFGSLLEKCIQEKSVYKKPCVLKEKWKAKWDLNSGHLFELAALEIIAK